MERTASLVPRMLRDLGLEDGVLGWRAVELWAEVVGPRIARHARAVAFQSGTLRVEVEAAAWRFELGFLKRRLLQSLAQRLGSPLVRDLQFVQTRGGIQR